MKKLTFDITVNPFTRKLNIVVLMDNKIHEVKIYFEGTDWWGSFDIKNKVFDIHCLYDESFSVNVYPVINGGIDTSQDQNVKLTIQL